ncbi:MAG: hypothetical protein AAFV19_20040 [Pseudomonadota bacterium]
MRASTALVSLAAIVGMTSPALAQFPGEKWSVDLVRVEGDAPLGVASAVNFGLRKAGEIYFYGDVSTRLLATVRDASSGIVDLKLIDSRDGSVIGERRGLPFAPVEGDVEPGSSAARSISDSVRAAALDWMGGLGCGDGCAVAVNNGAVEELIAAVTEKPAPAPTPAAKPEPEPTLAETPVIVDTPKAAEIPALADDTAPVEQPVVAIKDPEPAPRSVATAKVEPPKAKVEPPETQLATTVAEPKKPRVRVTAPSAAATKPDPKPAAPKIALADPDVSSARKISNQTQREAPALALTSPEPAPRRTAPVEEPAVTTTATEDRPTATAEQSSGLEIAATASDVAAPATPSPALPEPTAGGVAALAELPTATDDSVATSDADTAPRTVTRAPTPETTVPDVPSALAADTPEIEAGDTADAVRLPTAAQIEAPAASVAAEAPLPPPEETPVDDSPVVARVEESDVQISLVNPAAPETGDVDLGTPAALPSEPTTSLETESGIDASISTVLEGEVTEVAPAPQVQTAPPAATVEPPETVAEPDDLEGEQLALADPVAPVTPPVAVPPAASSESAPSLESTAPAGEGEEDPVTTVETKVAAVDPTTSEGPTLANARWVGFTPAVFTGSDQRDGTWISGPFDRQQRTGWITDTATGATTEVTFIWRDAGSGGRTATLSRAAAEALGLGQGDVANVAVYLPR